MLPINIKYFKGYCQHLRAVWKRIHFVYKFKKEKVITMATGGNQDEEMVKTPPYHTAFTQNEFEQANIRTGLEKGYVTQEMLSDRIGRTFR